MELSISVRRAQEVLQAAPHPWYRKMRAVPWMTERNFAGRVDWIKNHISWNSEWRNVIFSNEKKFNLDGPGRTHVLLALLEKTQARHKSSSLRWWLCDGLRCNFVNWKSQFPILEEIEGGTETIVNSNFEIIL